MANIAKYIEAVAHHLQADSILNPMVDGQVIPGFRRSQADDYLSEAQEACIGVRNLSKNSQGLPGCAYHGMGKHDQLVEIRIITMLSTTRTDDAYAYAIAAEVERILLSGFEETLNGVTYRVPCIPDINFTSLDDDKFNDRIEVQATFRMKYMDV